MSDPLGEQLPSKDDRPSPVELSLIAARCFQGGDGRRLLTYLRAITLERTLGPGADASHLRHLEGQRQFVQHLSTLIERGRTGTPDSSITNHEIE